MLERLSNINFIRGNKVASICFTLLEGEAYILDSCILVNKKNNVSVEKHISDFRIEELPEHIKNTIPLVLFFDGKGVLHKNVTEEKINLKELLPNVNLNDFYVQQHQLKQCKPTVSITRKTAIDKFIEDIIARGYYIQSVNYGPHSCFLFQEYFTNFPESLYTRKNNYKIDHDEVMQSNESIDVADLLNIGNEQFRNYEVIPYLIALGFFINISETKNISIKPSLNWDDFIYKNLFVYLRWGLLGIFFLVLMLNYIIFDSVNSKRTELQNRIQSTNQIITEIKTLTSDLEVKESIISETGLSSQSRYSAYSDEIAATLPGDIILTRINFQPLSGQIREGEEIQTLVKEIFIEGLTKSSIELNSWFKIMRQKKWIHKIDIINYSHNSESSYGEFSIRIKIK